MKVLLILAAVLFFGIVAAEEGCEEEFCNRHCQLLLKWSGGYCSGNNNCLCWRPGSNGKDREVERSSDLRVPKGVCDNDSCNKDCTLFLKWDKGYCGGAKSDVCLCQKSVCHGEDSEVSRADYLQAPKGGCEDEKCCKSCAQVGWSLGYCMDRFNKAGCMCKMHQHGLAGYQPYYKWLDEF